MYNGESLAKKGRAMHDRTAWALLVKVVRPRRFIIVEYGAIIVRGQFDVDC